GGEQAGAGGDAGARHHQVDSGEQRLTVLPQAELHRPRELLEHERVARADVREAHANPPRREGTRDRLARAPRAPDEGVAWQRHQRSFRVESASSAQTTETIQKRTMIWGSGHPRSSK